MPTANIPLSTLSVQGNKPQTRFGSPAKIPLRNSGPNQQMLLRGSIASIPAGAVVSSAEVRLYQAKAGAGSVALTITSNAGPWSSKTTFATKPSLLSGTAQTVTRTSPPARSIWTLPATSVVQSWVAGDVDAQGWTVTTTSATAGSLFGNAAPSLKPVLVVTYEVVPVPPSNLHPSSDGVVSTDKPTLTFEVPTDTSAIRVQVDPAGNGISPAFDTGEQAATAGLVNLAATTYPGLADGASTQWRAQARNPLGWSDWSPWVSFARQTWGTLTIESPGATSEDPSPTIAGSYSGVVTQWRARLLTTAGTVTDDSGWTPGDDIAFGTTKGVAAAGIAELSVRDDEERVATAGDEDYLTVTQPFTVVTSSTVAPLSSVTVSQDPYRPWVNLRVTRTEIPDEIAVRRDGDLVARVSGADAYDSPGVMVVRDLTAKPNEAAVYTVSAVVNGSFSRAVRADEYTPRCSGIWLIDEESGEDVVIWGDDDQEQSEPEVAIVHTPIGGNVVRRRLARSPRQGTIEGQLADVSDLLAATCEARLREWAEQDAGHPYRLVLGNRNDPVIVGDIELIELPGNGDERLMDTGLSWWAR